jgi:hypothetical protein
MLEIDEDAAASAGHAAAEVGEAPDDAAVHQFVTDTHDQAAEQRGVHVGLDVHVATEGRRQRRAQPVGLV